MPRIGDYVMVRSHDQGVVIGYYTGGFGRNCRLERARQLFGWEAEALTLFDLAQTHPLKTALRMSKELPWVEMTEACGFLPVDPSLVEAFLNHPYNYEP